MRVGLWGHECQSDYHSCMRRAPDTLLEVHTTCLREFCFTSSSIGDVDETEQSNAFTKLN